MNSAPWPEAAVEADAAPSVLNTTPLSLANQVLLMAWLRLACTAGIGPVSGRQLATACGGAIAIWQTPPEDLKSIEGVSERALQALAASTPQQAEDILALCAAQGIGVLCLEDDAYPTRLRQLDDAPLILFARGRIAALNHPRQLAVVGARKADNEGRLLTRRWCAHLAAQDISIISGMAYGIDAAAHGGALDAGETAAPTIAVLGCGLASPFSPVQQKQIAAISERGCVVSEFFPEEEARPANFPRRNRIIAGLSAATLVMQADIKSGSLITARLAGDYGREVLALPGSTLAGRHAGCHQLLRDGATLVESNDDILLAMGWQGGARTPRIAYTAANEHEAKIMAVLDGSIMHIDALAEDCGLTVSELSPILLGLELLGVVDALPGSRYTLGRIG
ncbi:MAG: DNA-processing protein DprA [Mariprofundaceae bacterium]|nr:DNA-processing protein DprA [Mariprofundaceae bacterium]